MPSRFLYLPRKAKQWIVLCIDIFLSLIATYISFVLRFDDFHISHYTQWVPYIQSLLFVPIFIKYGLYRAIFRHSGLDTINQANKACFIYGIFYLIFTIIFENFYSIPIAIGILQPIIFSVFIVLNRSLGRLWLYRLSSSQIEFSDKRFLLIYGATLSGIQIARSLADSQGFKIVGYIDDDPTLVWKQINGIQIYPTSIIDQKIKELAVTDVLIAKENLDKVERKKLISMLFEKSVFVRTLPSISDLATGKLFAKDLQDFNLDDLLNREPIAFNHEIVSENISGKIILITGAGGSIGSELSRQVFAFNPRTIVLVDHSEYALYQVSQELKLQSIEGDHVQFVSILADISDYEYMSKIVKQYSPSTIYHAAAYKHVPMVESNPFVGILNNVFGTLVMARIAIESKVEKFILISTDKAVRPTSIMGASKRIAELCLQALSAEDYIEFSGNSKLIKNETILTMVRFGNVLGSSGSVIPLFMKQIECGGPITITDRRVTRYFMSISDASKLVILAGIMSSGGEVFVLDMGEPIEVTEIAKMLTQFMGKSIKDGVNSKGDIEIVEIGLRQGEKLHEELLIGNNPKLTDHPKIMFANEVMIDWVKLLPVLNELKDAVTSCDEVKTKSIVQLLVSGCV